MSSIKEHVLEADQALHRNQCLLVTSGSLVRSQYRQQNSDLFTLLPI
jgi:hypothetical protein